MTYRFSWEAIQPVLKALFPSGFKEPFARFTLRYSFDVLTAFVLFNQSNHLAHSG